MDHRGLFTLRPDERRGSIHLVEWIENHVFEFHEEGYYRWIWDQFYKCYCYHLSNPDFKYKTTLGDEIIIKHSHAIEIIINKINLINVS